MLHNWHGWGDRLPSPLRRMPPPSALPAIVSRPVTHSRLATPALCQHPLGRVFFADRTTTEVRGPGAATVRPVSNFVSTPSDLPRLRRFVCSVSD